MRDPGSVSPAAGYSGTPLVTKLGIKPAMRVAVRNAPAGIETTLGRLPDGVSLHPGLRRGQKVDLVLTFETERKRFDRDLGWVVSCLPPDGPCWVAWPKRASKVPTDITDGVVREVALPMGWVDIKVCAIDATWTGLKLVLRKELRPARDR